MVVCPAGGRGDQRGGDARLAQRTSSSGDNTSQRDQRADSGDESRLGDGRGWIGKSGLDRTVGPHPARRPVLNSLQSSCLFPPCPVASPFSPTPSPIRSRPVRWSSVLALRSRSWWKTLSTQARATSG